MKSTTIPDSLRFPKSTGLLFILFFLALSAVTLSIWQGWSFIAARADRDELIERAATEQIKTLTEGARNYFSGTAVSLDIIANAPVLREFDKESEQAVTALEHMFLAVLRTNPAVFQLRYIDASGWEIVRIDRYRGETFIVPPDQLQFKGDRGYFVEGMATKPGSIYVSDIDLNVERGMVEVPWKPTVRIAAPIFRDADAETERTPSALLVMNIDAGALLGLFTEAVADTHMELMLINDEGYWIHGRSVEQLWRFMFDQPGTIDQVYPEVWETLVEEPSGQFTSGSDTWTYTRTTVATVFPESLLFCATDKTLWYFLIRSTGEEESIQPLDAIAPASVILALVLLSLGWTKSATDRRQAEEELIKSQKLSSLGGLVAGVSHELNTPIGSAITVASTIHGDAQAIRRQIDGGRVQKSAIVEFVSAVDHGSSMMLSSLNRAAELITHFKRISVDQSLDERRSFDLDEYVTEIADTMSHLFKNNGVLLKLDMSSHASLHAYPGPLSQVVINLVQNALTHAFDPDDGGTITVATKSVNSREVEISVTDTGKGISPDLIDRIFEPFFTTKFGQGGTGLGLHIVYNIVTEALGGSIHAESDPQKHLTVFRVTIPLTAPQSAKNARYHGYE